MGKIYQKIMVSNPVDDEERFRAIINEAIEKDEVEAFPLFTEESQKSIDQRIARAKREGEEAEDYAKEIGVHDKVFGGKGKAKGKGKGESDMSSLAAMIQQRQKSRSDDFLDNLAEKYGAAPKKKGKKRAPSPDEPPEEAFERTAKRKTRKSKN